MWQGRDEKGPRHRGISGRAFTLFFFLLPIFGGGCITLCFFVNMIDSVECTKKLRQKFRLWREFSTNRYRDSALFMFEAILKQLPKTTKTTKPGIKMTKIFRAKKHYKVEKFIYIL